MEESIDEVSPFLSNGCFISYWGQVQQNFVSPDILRYIFHNLNMHCDNRICIMRIDCHNAYSNNHKYILLYHVTFAKSWHESYIKQETAATFFLLNNYLQLGIGLCVMVEFIHMGLLEPQGTQNIRRIQNEKFLPMGLEPGTYILLLKQTRWQLHHKIWCPQSVKDDQVLGVLFTFTTC